MAILAKEADFLLSVATFFFSYDGQIAQENSQAIVPLLVIMWGIGNTSSKQLIPYTHVKIDSAGSKN